MNGRKGYLVDTNVLIYFLQGRESAVKLMKNIIKSQQKIYVSIITVIEILSYKGLTKREENKIREMFKKLPVIFLNWEIAKKTAELARKYKLKVPDGIIAASCLVNNLVLLSADKVFRKLKELKFEEFIIKS